MENFRDFNWLKRLMGSMVWAVGLVFVISGAPLLAEPPEFLASEVVITGSGWEESLARTASSVTVLSVEKLKKKGLTYVSQALVQVPGAEVRSNGFFGGLTTLGLRGSQSEQVLVLLDGKKLNSSQNGVYDFSGLPLDNLERIEIVRFPLSALYGADALGGVVNLISRAPRARKGDINFQTGGFGENKYSLGYQDAYAGYGYRFNLNFIDSLGSRPNSDFQGRTYNFSLALPESWLKTSFDYCYQKSARGIPGSSVFPSASARQNDENNLFSGMFSFSAPENLHNKLSYYYNQFAQDYRDPLFGDNSHHKNKNAGLDYLNNFSLFESQQLTTGFSYRDENIISSDVGEHRRDTLALLAQDEIKLTDNFDLVAGGRLEKLGSFGKIFSPRLGGIFRAPADINVKISWSRGFRAPTFNELYWPQTPWAGGNPDLRPEEGEAYDLEVAWTFGPVKIKTGGFLGQTFNMINWASDPMGVWRPQNLFAVNRRGLEASAEYAFGWAEFFGNISWQNVTDISAGNEVTYMPHYKATAGVNLKNDSGNFGGGLTGRYIGWRLADHNSVPGRILPAFMVFDGTVFVKIADWTFRTGVDNLFDEVYQEVADYPAAGRRAWLSAGVEF